MKIRILRISTDLLAIFGFTLLGIYLYNTLSNLNIHIWTWTLLWMVILGFVGAGIMAYTQDLLKVMEVVLCVKGMKLQE